jgi:hypothetical protein
MMERGSILWLVLLGVMVIAAPCAAEIYWCEGGWSAGTIYRSTLYGSRKEQLFTSDTRAVAALALEAGEGKLYWTGRDKIQRSNLDGTNVEDLIVGDFFSEGLALDPDDGKMYWTDYHSNIQRANLDGTNIEILHSRPDHTYGLALDLSREKMYWSERGYNYENDIRCSELSGTSHQYFLDGGTDPLGKE